MKKSNGMQYSGYIILGAGIILFLVYSNTDIIMGSMYLAAGIILGIIIIWGQKKFLQDKQKMAQEERNETERLQNELFVKTRKIYDSFIEQYGNPPSSTQTVTVIGQPVSDCWIHNEQLCLLSDLTTINKKIRNTYIYALRSDCEKRNYDAYICALAIPVKQIHFYKSDGDIYTETNVSGGGGGGSSISGAIIGGIIGGDAGAIIGSREKIDPITSSTIVHDSRAICLYYNQPSDDMRIIKFSPDSYSSLLAIIPEKDHSYVIRNESVSQKNVKNDITDKLLKLKELKDLNLITEEEFLQKKQEILNDFKL